jgi:PAS domain S-box-containing protein
MPFDELAMRLGQQELVAGLGMYALEAVSIDLVMEETCRVAALGLRTGFAKVLRPRPQADDLLVVAGVGWRPGVVGNATLGSDLDSPAGFALHSGQPVLSNDLRGESRFRMPALLVEHGVQSAINVPVGGAGRTPYGVLEVDSTARHGFVAADTTFLQSLGNVLAAAVVRSDMDQAAGQREALARQVFESNPDCVKVLDLEGRLLAINVNGALALEAAGPDELVGSLWPEWWPVESQPTVLAAVADAARGVVARFTAPTRNRAGATVWWDMLVAPVLNGNGQPFRLVAMSRNATARIESERAKDSLLRDKDLLMQEVHHRVKNSLQLVRTLLQLQGRSASDETRAQLDEAARRIMTIGAVHQRLYEGGSVVETDAAAYVEALLGDMRTMLADSVNGREIVLQAEPLMLTADQMTPLGLVVSELVTNALKYGDGRVLVSLRRVPAGLEVVVEDHGPGFPEAFDPGRRSGLGMRLITALAKGEGPTAIQVDRNVPHSRVVVMLTL